MAESRHLLLVLSADALAHQPNAEGWVHQVLAGCFEELPEDSVVLTGGAPGPDTWACEAAEGYGLRWVVYLPDGRRLDSTDDGATERRWSSNAVGAREHGRALVEAAQKARAAGWGVRVVAMTVAGEGLGSAEGVASMARTEGFTPERAELDA